MTDTSTPTARTAGGGPPSAEADWIHLIGQTPELALSMRPVVVVSPHPDDEALAVGGLVAELRDRDVPVTVVAVTDGESSHPGARGVGPRRVREQVAALRELGVDASLRLALPDGEVADHVDELAAAVRDACGPDTVLVAPWDRDGHPDHDACGRTARSVARELGIVLHAFPVRAYRWARVDDLSGLDLRRITLSEAAREAKARALACYASQLADDDGPAPVGTAELARFLRPWELVIASRAG